MRVTVIGAGGMIGRRFASALAADPEPGLAALELLDTVAPEAPAGAAFPVEAGVLDLTDAAAVARRVAARPDVIVHLSLSLIHI